MNSVPPARPKSLVATRSAITTTAVPIVHQAGHLHSRSGTFRFPYARNTDVVQSSELARWTPGATTTDTPGVKTPAALVTLVANCENCTYRSPKHTSGHHSRRPGSPGELRQCHIAIRSTWICDCKYWQRIKIARFIDMESPRTRTPTAERTLKADRSELHPAWRPSPTSTAVAAGDSRQPPDWGRWTTRQTLQVLRHVIRRHSDGRPAQSDDAVSTGGIHGARKRRQPGNPRGSVSVQRFRGSTFQKLLRGTFQTRFELFCVFTQRVSGEHLKVCAGDR